MMPIQKAPEAPGKTAAAGGNKTSTRKRWIKKTPLDIVMEQEQKLRDEVAELEGELKTKRQQLQKFEDFRKSVQASGS
jgi:hypothetical protein